MRGATGPLLGEDDEHLVTLWGLLVETFALLGGELEREVREATGLESSRFEVLLRLGRSPGGRLPMGQLAREVSFSSGGATRLVDRMVGAGLVERVPDERDRRVTWAAITPTGREHLARALEVHLPGLRRHLAAHLEPTERVVLERVLRRLRSVHTRPEPPERPARDRP